MRMPWSTVSNAFFSHGRGLSPVLFWNEYGAAIPHHISTPFFFGRVCSLEVKILSFITRTISYNINRKVTLTLDISRKPVKSKGAQPTKVGLGGVLDRPNHFQEKTNTRFHSITRISVCKRNEDRIGVSTHVWQVLIFHPTLLFSICFQHGLDT